MIDEVLTVGQKPPQTPAPAESGRPAGQAAGEGKKNEPEVKVLVTRDRMEATLQVIVPSDARLLEMSELLEKVRASGVVFGLNEDAVKRAYNTPGFSITIAKGQAAINGENASIKHFVQLEKKGQPRELEDGTVDYKNLNLFVVVQPGDVLAEKIPATPGTPGTDVLGNTLGAKPGKDIPLPLGKNVVADGNLIIAEIAGQLLIANNKINVVPVIEIKGDVDLSTGNIDFIGDVIIRGSVQPGFSVKAEGNVEVHGAVSGAIIEARNVVIRMGIQGMHRGYVKAKETLAAKFIENANVHAGVEIFVGDVILNSKVSAGKRVKVEGRRGLIAGGSVMAGEEIIAKIIGTHMATVTAVEVGVNPALRDEYQQIRTEIKKVDTTLETTQKALGILRSMNQNTLPPEKREMMLKLTKAQFHLTGQVETMKNRLAVIQKEFDEMLEGKIKVADIIYPGVKIVVGTLIKPITEVLRFTTFYAEGGEIKIGSFK